MIEVRACRAADGRLLRDARLRALRDAPRQFGSTHEEAAARPSGKWRAQAAETDGSGHALVVFALRDGEPVGMAGIVRDRGVRRCHRARIWGVWVAPDVRGRGVARRLVTALLDWARERGVVAVYLDIVEGNDPARALYRHLGFVRRDVDPYALCIDGEFVAQQRLVLLLRPGLEH